MRKKGKIYFGQETEDAIVLYNNTEDMATRNQIFNDRIHKPLSKMIENITNTYKTSYSELSWDNMQMDCLSFLVEKLPTFNPNYIGKDGKKGRAFSYFSVIARHYLLLNSQNTYKRFQRHVPIIEYENDVENDGIETKDGFAVLESTDDYYRHKEHREYMKLLIEYYEKNRESIFRKRHLPIVDHVLEILKSDGALVDSYKVRYIRNCIKNTLTDRSIPFSRPAINVVLKKMRSHNEKLKMKYLQYGHFQNKTNVRVEMDNKQYQKEYRRKHRERLNQYQNNRRRKKNNLQPWLEFPEESKCQRTLELVSPLSVPDLL